MVRASLMKPPFTKAAAAARPSIFKAVRLVLKAFQHDMSSRRVVFHVRAQCRAQKHHCMTDDHQWSGYVKSSFHAEPGRGAGYSGGKNMAMAIHVASASV